MKNFLISLGLIIFLLINLPSIMAQSVSLSTNATKYGESITVYWSGFSGDVNIKFYKGNTFITYANTNVSGTGQQELTMTNEAVGNNYQLSVGNNYRIVVELRSNININRTSENFSLSMPSVSISSNNVDYGSSLTLYWSGFADNVNILFYKGTNFITYANTNVSGSGQQTITLTNEAVGNNYSLTNGNNYYFKVELRNNTIINEPSQNFTVRLLGSLKVNLLPNAAITAGAKWKLNDGVWQNSGSLLSGINVGSHTIIFKPIVGWNTPANKSVTINANQTVNETATYSQNTQFGAIKVNIYPSQAVDSGAQWRLDEGDWQNSGTVLENTPMGTYNLNFKNITGWTPPENKTLTIYENQTINESGTYLQYGSVKVTLSPSDAVSAGAQWKLDNGDWQNSNSTLNVIEAGTYTVHFKTVLNWDTPASKNIIVSFNQVTFLNAEYIYNNTNPIDDYPEAYKNSTPCNRKVNNVQCGGSCTIDIWGFYRRECTSFVAWRINRDQGNTNASSTDPFRNDKVFGQVPPEGKLGDAINWASRLEQMGYTVDNIPQVGDIAFFNLGHVAYVQSINSDGTVRIEEYNWFNTCNDRGIYGIRTTKADKYIHIKQGRGANTSISTMNNRINQENHFYPNPTNGIISFYGLSITGTKIQIYNFIGQLVYSSYLSLNNRSIDLTHLLPGVYILKSSSDDIVISQKLIKHN